MVYVPQEPFLFPWTIRDNLALVRSDLQLEDVARALEVACAEFVWELPHGLLLLDEPGANLDACTEEELLRRLRAFMRGRAMGIVTHRLGLIGDQDWVIVLQNRRVASQGYHAELLQRSPLYAAMQSEFRDDGDPR